VQVKSDCIERKAMTNKHLETRSAGSCRGVSGSPLTVVSVISTVITLTVMMTGETDAHASRPARIIHALVHFYDTHTHTHACPTKAT